MYGLLTPAAPRSRTTPRHERRVRRLGRRAARLSATARSERRRASGQRDGDQAPAVWRSAQSPLRTPCRRRRLAGTGRSTRLAPSLEHALARIPTTEQRHCQQQRRQNRQYAVLQSCQRLTGGQGRQHQDRCCDWARTSARPLSRANAPGDPHRGSNIPPACVSGNAADSTRYVVHDLPPQAEVRRPRIAFAAATLSQRSTRLHRCEPRSADASIPGGARR